jgi:RHS repeat-associated protein
LKVLRTDYTYDDADHLLNLSNKSYKISPPEEPPRPEWGFLRKAWNDVQDLFRWGPRTAEAAGYVISEYTYTYDNVGNRLTMQKGQSTTNYVYDHIYELTSTSGAQTHSYDYDAVGNRETADNVSYVPTSVNQYDSVGGVDYTYDDPGNLHSDGTNTYTYDYENRLSGVTTPSHSLSFGYDPLGRRVTTTIDGSTTVHVYDDIHVVAEYDGDNTLLREFTYGPRVDEVVSMLNAVTGTRYYYLSDGLGSVSEVVGTNTSVVERYEYTPFGTTTVKNGSGQTISETAIGNPWAFTGRRYDAKAALYDYRARHYAPTIGRFMQRDPLGYVDGINPYPYTGNNPVSSSDPLGLQYQTVSSYQQFVARFWSEYWQGTLDFMKTWAMMHGRNDVNTRYYHCLANCLANRRGLGGVAAAHSLSALRELRDFLLASQDFNDTEDAFAQFTDCKLDLDANRIGRKGDPQLSCPEVCAGLR